MTNEMHKLTTAQTITADVVPGEFFDGDGNQIEDLAGEHDPKVTGLGSECVIYKFADGSRLMVTSEGWTIA